MANALARIVFGVFILWLFYLNPWLVAVALLVIFILFSK